MLRKVTPPMWISAVALTLAFIDIFFLKISATALGLVAIAASPWLLGYLQKINLSLRKLKTPGGFEFEFSEFSQEAEKAGLLKTSNKKYSFEEIYDRDPNLALAGLRIEIEKRMNKLAELSGHHQRRQSMGYLIRALNRNGVLHHQEFNLLADLIPALNKAVHAQDLDEHIYDWVMETGPKLLAGIDEKIANSNQTP